MTHRVARDWKWLVGLTIWFQAHLWGPAARGRRHVADCQKVLAWCCWFGPPFVCGSPPTKQATSGPAHSLAHLTSYGRGAGTDKAEQWSNAAWAGPASLARAGTVRVDSASRPCENLGRNEELLYKCPNITTKNWFFRYLHPILFYDHPKLPFFC